MDVLIKNAKIIDGSGEPAYFGSVGIEGGKIVLSDLPETADLVIDAKRRVLAPGFIDAHSPTGIWPSGAISGNYAS